MGVAVWTADDAITQRGRALRRGSLPACPRFPGKDGERAPPVASYYPFRPRFHNLVGTRSLQTIVPIPLAQGLRDPLPEALPRQAERFRPAASRRHSAA